jgi:hypothetical protein
MRPGIESCSQPGSSCPRRPRPGLFRERPDRPLEPLRHGCAARRQRPGAAPAALDRTPESRADRRHAVRGVPGARPGAGDDRSGRRRELPAVRGAARGRRAGARLRRALGWVSGPDDQADRYTWRRIEIGADRARLSGMLAQGELSGRARGEHGAQRSDGSCSSVARSGHGSLRAAEWKPSARCS